MKSIIKNPTEDLQELVSTNVVDTFRAIISDGLSDPIQFGDSIDGADDDVDTLSILTNINILDLSVLDVTSFENLVVDVRNVDFELDADLGNHAFANASFDFEQRSWF